jgi:hypothetical protein
VEERLGEKTTARNGCATNLKNRNGQGEREKSTQPRMAVPLNLKTELAVPEGSLMDLSFVRCRPGKGAAGNRFESTKFRAGAGPTPVFGPGHEICAYGIPFDVVADALEFGRVSDPMIEGLVLPKGFADAVEDGVCLSSRNAFQAIHEARNGGMRSDEQMNVVRHDHEGVEGVEAQFSFAEIDAVHDTPGNTGILQPKRACGGLVQKTVRQFEFLARRVPGKEGFCGTANPGCVSW